MPAPRAFTANMSNMAQILNNALELTAGVTVEFPCPPYSPASAKSTAKGLQSSFASLRARARRTAMKNRGVVHARDLDVKGPYDALMCVREELECGTNRVTFIKGEEYLAGMRIINNDTGELLGTLGAGQEEHTRLLNKAFRGIGGALTAKEWDRLTFLNAEANPGETPWHSPEGSLIFPRPRDTEELTLSDIDTIDATPGNVFDEPA